MSLNTMRTKFGHSAKWILGIVTAAMVITTFAWSWAGSGHGAGAASGPQTNPDDIVATADGVDISRHDYDQTAKSMADQMGGGSAMMAGFMRQQALDQSLEGAETLAAAKKMGITASPADIDAMRDKVLKQSDVRKKLSLPETATVSDIDAKLQTTNPNVSIATIFPDSVLERAAIMDKLQKRLTGDIVVTDQDARDSYKQWHTRHILVDNKKRSDEQAKKLANDLLAKAKAPNADFAALAKNSDDPGTKNKGGDDGWISMSTSYVPEFLDAVKTLKPGDITGPVTSSQYGYFIIKCDAVKEDLPKDFDKTKAAKIAEIEKTRKDKAESDFMQQVRSAQHVVTIKDPGIRADYEMEEAGKLPPTDPNQAAKYRAAIKDYQEAIKADNGGMDTTAYQLQLASAYSAIKDKANALANNEAAAKTTDDPQLWLTVGTAYKDMKQDDKALEAFGKASDKAYDNPYIHQQLQGFYKQMGKADLASKEGAKAKEIQAAQAAQRGPGSQMSLGGQPITVGGAQGGQPITVGGAQGGQPIEIKAAPSKGGAKPVVVKASPAPAPPKPNQ